MNDFVTQHYDSEDNITFDEFCGLNTETDYKTYINIDEKEFVFKIISDIERKKLLCDVVSKYVMKPHSEDFVYKFILVFIRLFMKLPSKEEVREFEISFSEHMKNKNPLSEQTMLEFIKNYFSKLIEK